MSALSDVVILLRARDETRAAFASVTRSVVGLSQSLNPLGGIAARVGIALASISPLVATKRIIDSADELRKASQKYGIAVETLSALKFAGALSDVDIEQIGVGLKQLSVNALDAAANTGDARLAFRALGISLLDANGVLQSSDTLLGELADKFAGMEDSTGKTALAVKLFGRAGAQLVPLLNMGRRGLADAKDEATALGAIVGGDLAMASEEFNDDLTRLSAALSAFGIAMARYALPTLKELTAELIIGIKEAGGFFNALVRFGTINPFRNNQENIRAYSAELTDVESKLNALKNAPAFSLQFGFRDDATERLTKRADILRQRIAYLKEIASAEALAGAGRGRLDAKDLGPAILAKAPLLPDEAAMRKAAADAKRLAQEAAKAFEDATKAIGDNALAAAEADAEIEKLRNGYIDTIEPAAAVMRELRKFEDIAPALGLSADEIERIRDAFRERIDVAQFGKPLDDLKDAMGEMSDFAKQAARNIQDAFADFLFDPFKGGLRGMLNGFQQTLRRMAAEALASRVLETIGSFGARQGGFFGSLLSELFANKRAAGGPVSPGNAYLVGERGPELFMPQASGRIIANGAGTMQVVQNFVLAQPADRRTQEQIAVLAGASIQRALLRDA